MLIKQEKPNINLFKSNEFLKNNYISYFLEGERIHLRPKLQNNGEVLHRISLYDFLHVINEYKIDCLEDKRIIPFLEELSQDVIKKENKDNYLFEDMKVSSQPVTLSLFTSNTEKGFLMGGISLYARHFSELKNFEFYIHYLLKDNETGLLYSMEFPIFNHDIFEIFRPEYISDIYFYDKNVLKKSIFSTSITSSFYLFEKINKTPKTITEPFEENICNNIFPFLKKKKKSNFMMNLISEILLPYRNNLSFLYSDLNSLDLTISTKEKLYKSLMKETNPVKQVQYFLPKANKETVKVLRELFHNPYEDSDGLFKHSTHIDYSFMNIFTTTERLNDFIKSIFFVTDENNSGVQYIMNNETFYFKKIYEFIEHELINFFNSREHMEQFLIKQMHLFTEEVFEEISNEELKREEEEDDDEYGELYDSYKETNFERLMDDLRETQYVYKTFKEMEKYFEDNPTKENMDKYYLMQTVYNKKYNRLKDIHDEMYLLYTDLKNEKINYPFSDLKEKDISLDEYSLFEVSSSTTLKEVGTRMNHCVLTYEHKILNNESFIFVIRNNYNNKFEICLEYSVLNNSIIQAKGNRNSIVRNKKVLELVKLFKEKNNLKIHTNDLPSKIND